MSVTWYGFTVTLEFSEEGPSTALGSLTWRDITTSLRSFDLNRGRNTELASYGVGTATFELDNTGRLFDTSNTAGTHFDYLLPMRRIRLKITAGATTATLFVGYVTGWPIDYPGRFDSRVTVRAVDAFDRLDALQPGSAYAAEVLADDPTYYWPLQAIDGDGESVGQVGGVDMRDYYHNVTFHPSGVVHSTSTATRTVPRGEDTYVIGPPWYATISGSAAIKTMEAWLSNYETPTSFSVVRFAASTTTWMRAGISDSVLQVGYSSAADNRYYTFASTGIRVDPATPAHVVLKVDASNLYAFVNGTQVWSGALSVGTSTGSFNPDVPSAFASSGDSSGDDEYAVSHFAGYTSALSDARIQAHYLAGLLAYGAGYGERGGARIGRILDSVDWPTADRTLSTGETVHGAWLPESASALDTIRAIEVTEQGLFFIAGDGTVTFRDRQWQMTATDAIVPQVVFGDGPAPSLEYRNFYSDTVDGTSFTFAACDIGAASNHRTVVAVVHYRADGSADQLTAIGATIGGAAMTRLVHVVGDADTVGTSGVAIFSLPVPSGTTADIVVTTNITAERMGVGVWRGLNLGAPSVGTDDEAATGASQTLTVSGLTGSVFLAGVILPGNNAIDWTGATERYDTGVESRRMSGADGTSGTIDATFTTSSASARRCVMAAVGWAAEINYRDVQIDGKHRDYLRNDVRVSNGSGTYAAADATSIAAYGRRQESLTATGLKGWLSRQLAAFRLRLRKDPTSRIPAIDLLPIKSTTDAAAIIGLDLGHRVTVTRRPSGGTGIFTQDLAVQGISHAADNSGRWDVRLYLAPAAPSYREAGYLTLADQRYGRIGATAANAVPY